MKLIEQIKADTGADLVIIAGNTYWWWRTTPLPEDECLAALGSWLDP